MDRILIAGTGSGCGKTTVTCVILGALKNRGIDTKAFKCGPDYIDPAFQEEVIGVNSYNLDSFMMTSNTIKYLLSEHAGEISVIDGIKGYYDGIHFSETASTCEMALITKTPTILVIDCNRIEASAAAVIYGYMKYSRNTVKGIIFNRLNPSLYDGMKRICEGLRIKCYGYIPKLQADVMENKNLSFVTNIEINDIKQKMAQLTAQAEKTLDIDGIIELSKTAKDIKYDPIDIPYIGKVRIAVSNDRAFCFHYRDNIEVLEKMGAEIVEFSPLNDKELPENIDGMFICGGYPEMYGLELTKNKTMLASVKEAVKSGVPTIAECGGFMYLHDTMNDVKGVKYKMAGAIEGNCVRVKPPINYGYIEFVSDTDNMLLEKGGVIKTYEFHRYESTNHGSSFITERNGEKMYRIHATDTLYAGFPHLHFYSNLKMAEGFMRACLK
ncbi:MAG: cobyrinate a,c-diamide synthase [Clostridiales bacterium]|nr:cobyrinate a,c-diamide synthase [Clostridiales bacterium]